jgi:hypothetical protein
MSDNNKKEVFLEIASSAGDAYFTALGYALKDAPFTKLKISLLGNAVDGYKLAIDDSALSSYEEARQDYGIVGSLIGGAAGGAAGNVYLGVIAAGFSTALGEDVGENLFDVIYISEQAFLESAIITTQNLINPLEVGVARLETVFESGDVPILVQKRQELQDALNKRNGLINELNQLNSNTENSPELVTSEPSQTPPTFWPNTLPPSQGLGEVQTHLTNQQETQIKVNHDTENYGTPTQQAAEEVRENTTNA